MRLRTAQPFAFAFASALPLLFLLSFPEGDLPFCSNRRKILIPKIFRPKSLESVFCRHTPPVTL
jgi:hypothetical protein